MVIYDISPDGAHPLSCIIYADIYLVLPLGVPSLFNLRKVIDG